MNIAYTINGEGMGHATRSSVVIEHLLSRGHRVAVFSAGKKPLAFLRKKFDTVAEVTGLHMVYRDNKVKRLRTAARVLGNVGDIRGDIKTIRTTLASFSPEVVITDFDFHGQIVSSLFHVPVISVDNIQYITQADFRVAAEDYIDYELNYLIAKMMVPRADHYFITTFATAPVRRTSRHARHVTFVPPILRPAVESAIARRGMHVLVYQTVDSDANLYQVLAQTKERFIVYNMRRRFRAPNITVKEFSERGFIADMASAKAVIANGGFNVITESLYFGKPVLSIPIRSFYEQKLNGLLLQEQGFGLAVNQLSKSSLAEFLARTDRYAMNIKRLKFENAILWRALDTVLQNIRAGLLRRG